MNIGDELNQLDDLHRRGVIDDAEFARAKARVIDGMASAERPRHNSVPAVDAFNRLRRTRDDRWLGGVCGGLARLCGLESWAVRLFFVLLLLCAGTGVLLYILLWIFVPEDPLRVSYTPGPTPAG